MHLRPLFASLALFGLAGCSTIQRPPDEIAEVPVTRINALGVAVTGARLQVIDGRLTISGSARKTSRTTMTLGVHLDVRFIDVSGREIALRTINVHLNRSRFGTPPASSFASRLDPWPAGTQEIVIKPHNGRHAPSTS